MNPPCARCKKTVYPMEKLSCLDKYWHKACFKCEGCGLTLNMKNYKGYNKLPYCNAHYPTTRFTAVADTPENARLAQNTKNQSSVQYHEEFEKSRGHYTQVADDAETRRVVDSQIKISSVVYHDQFEKDKGKYTQIADDPETLRNLKNQSTVSMVVYHDKFEKDKGKYTQIADDPETLRNLKNQSTVSMVQYHEQFEKSRGHYTPVSDDPETQRLKQNTALQSNVEYRGLREKNQEREAQRRSSGQADGRKPHHLGQAVLPQEEAKPSPYSDRNQSYSVTYSSQGKSEPSARRQIGSIHEYDPMNENFGSLQQGYLPNKSAPNRQEWSETVSVPAPAGMGGYGQQTAQQPQHYPPPATEAPPPQPVPAPVQPPQPVVSEPAPPPPQPPVPSGPTYRAMYDYEAADEDEVSFLDGDVITDVEQIDAGWMVGTVRRSGLRGMLPANYVEQE